jgi:hypothetical protein
VAGTQDVRRIDERARAAEGAEGDLGDRGELARPGVGPADDGARGRCSDRCEHGPCGDDSEDLARHGFPPREFLVLSYQRSGARKLAGTADRHWVSLDVASAYAFAGSTPGPWVKRACLHT